MITLTNEQIKAIAKRFEKLCEWECNTVVLCQYDDCRDFTAYGYVDVTTINKSVFGNNNKLKLTHFWLLDENENHIDIVDYDSIVEQINLLLC